jgi:hypothetical protein
LQPEEKLSADVEAGKPGEKTERVRSIEELIRLQFEVIWLTCTFLDGRGRVTCKSFTIVHVALG